MKELWLNLPLLIIFGGIVIFLFSRVEQPIARAKMREQREESLLHLAEVLKRQGFPIKEVDRNKSQLRIEAERKLLDLVLRRIWSKELVFRIESNNDLLVVGKPWAWNAKTRPLMTDDQLQQIMSEVADDSKFIPPV